MAWFRFLMLLSVRADTCDSKRNYRKHEHHITDQLLCNQTDPRCYAAIQMNGLKWEVWKTTYCPHAVHWQQCLSYEYLIKESHIWVHTQAWKTNLHMKTHICSCTVYTNGRYWALSASHPLQWPTTHSKRSHLWHFWVNSLWTTGLWAALTQYTVHRYYILWCTRMIAHAVAHTVLVWLCDSWSPGDAHIKHNESKCPQDSSYVSCLQPILLQYFFWPWTLTPVNKRDFCRK